MEDAWRLERWCRAPLVVEQHRRTPGQPSRLEPRLQGLRDVSDESVASVTGGSVCKSTVSRLCISAPDGHGWDRYLPCPHIRVVDHVRSRTLLPTVYDMNRRESA